MACEGQWCLTLRVALEGAHRRNEFRPVPEAKRLGGHLSWRTARPDPMREKRGVRGAPGWVSPSPRSTRGSLLGVPFPGELPSSLRTAATTNPQ